MVETIRPVNTLPNQQTRVIQDAPMLVPHPRSMAVRFGRTIVVIVETNKKLMQLFEQSMQQIRDFLAGLQEAFILTANDLFTPYYEKPQDPKPLLKTAPAWTFHSQRLRSCRLEQLPSSNEKIKPTLQIAARTFNRLIKEKPEHSPLATTHYGAGIPNGQNCCFIASVLQALRFSHSFRERLKSRDLKEMPVVQELLNIYSIIEGKRNQAKRTLTATEINNFRKLCIEQGFEIDSEMSQEDSAHFCQFLLGQVGFIQFRTKEYNKHSFEVPVNALDKGSPIRDNQVVFQIADSEVSDLESLIKDRQVIVEVEPKLVQKDLEEKGLLTEEIKTKLQAMKDVELVPVKQTTQMYRDDLPHVLPVYLERSYYNRATHQVSLNTRKVEPNTFIDFPLADPEYAGCFARYEWVSAVTRASSLTDSTSKVIDKNSGHYAAWVHYDHKGDSVFAEYDAGASRLHSDTASRAHDNIAQNSRLFIYEFRGIVKA